MPPYHQDDRVTLLHGDVLEELATLPANSIHVCVTSPPYWGQRSYQTEEWEGGNVACEHSFTLARADSDPTKRGSIGATHGGTIPDRVCKLCGARRVDRQIGLEDTVADYIEHMVAVFREVRRVLRDEGTLWLNLGDKYAESGGAHTEEHANPGLSNSHQRSGGLYNPSLPLSGYKAQDLIPLSWLVALALQADGWILRSAIVWEKPSSMPESVNGWRWEQHHVKVGAKPRGQEPYRQGSNPKHPQQEPYRQGSNPKHPQQDHDGEYFKQSAEWKPCPGCRVCSPNDGLVLRKGQWRPTSATEMIFLLIKTNQYYCDGVALRTAHKDESVARFFRGSNADGSQPYRRRQGPRGTGVSVYEGTGYGGDSANFRGDRGSFGADGLPIVNLAGANIRNVWRFNSGGGVEGHYAQFPVELPLRCIQAGASLQGYCSDCGAPWARVVERTIVGSYHDHDAVGVEYGKRQHGKGPAAGYGGNAAPTLGWRPTCGHTGRPVPGMVLDPFMGHGATAIAALQLGQNVVGIDLNAKYLTTAVERIRQARLGQKMRAMPQLQAGREPL